MTGATERETKPPAETKPAETKPVEEWAREKGTPDWLFAGARLGHRWPVGRVLTEADFDAAIEKAAHTTAG